ncbi:MAG: hypothetical protein OHK0011_20550 [Turneriella sp.]
MKEVVFLLEEQSAREFIQVLAAKFFSIDVKLTFIVFEGKRDLERRIGMKLRAYLNPEAFFIVLEDQDSADCKTLKQKLLQNCSNAGKSDRCLVRIACKELESWYLADLAAVGKAYNKPTVSNEQDREKFRNPERLANPTQELRRLVPEFQKISGARQIAAHIDASNERSRSFAVFIQGLKKVNEMICFAE